MKCEVNRSYMNESMPQLMLSYAVQVLSTKYVMDIDEQDRTSARVYVKPPKVIDMQNSLDASRISEAYFSMKTLIPHNMSYLVTCLDEKKLFNIAKSVAEMQWSNKQR